MSLSTGQRLGPYEILSPLGAGGMGEVWKARDNKLNRDVAIKILPETFASDKDRLARFRREAQVLASLNHPHIAAIYGLEESGAMEALVLELVDGETLAERLARGPLPVEEALKIARQIAEALEAAHERGIVHRDLKPANVKLTADGNVKVLDFGLAKAMAGDVSSPDVSTSPTITAVATEAGIVVGSAAYMSPEQARGRSVDRRADIWAFGATLWEILTGRRLFEGDTVSDTLASVLRQEIDYAALPKDTPDGVLRLLRRCLERDLRSRLHDIADARLEIEESLKAPVRRVEPQAPASSGILRALRWAPWLIAAAALFSFFAVSRRRPGGTEDLVRLSVVFPEKLGPDWHAGEQEQVLAISPDGRRIAFSGKSGQERRIFLRDLSGENPEPVFGTEEGSNPFFSPDGEWLGFVAGDKLKKTAIRGGTPMTLASVPRCRGAVWCPDGTIVFASTVSTPLVRVSAAGGEARPLTSLDEAARERTHRWPEVVPEGNWVLFTVGTADKPGDYDDSRIDAVSLATGKRHSVYRGASLARYWPPDRLLLARRGEILSAPFDPKTATVRGLAAPVVQGVSGDARSGVAYFDVSRTGTLAYGVGLSTQGVTEIGWFDRTGRHEPTGIPPGLYSQISLSPDGQKLAYAEGPGGGARSDVWIADLAHSGYFQLTSTGRAMAPTWTVDGASVVFSTPNGDTVFRQRADGSAAAEVLWKSPYLVPVTMDSFSPDGSALLVTLNGLPTQADIFRIPLIGERVAQPFIATPRAEHEGMISPNGKWVAYSGEYETGAQIYVQPYPSLAGRWQISRNGGAGPRWSRDGKELFFVWNDQLFAVSIREEPTFSPGEPRPVFKIERPSSSEWNQTYDISPDGKRFIVLLRKEEANSQPRLDVVLNWAQHLAGSR